MPRKYVRKPLSKAARIRKVFWEHPDWSAKRIAEYLGPGFTVTNVTSVKHRIGKDK